MPVKKRTNIQGGAEYMERSRDTITWQQWCNSQAIMPKVRYRRKFILNEWSKANGKNNPDELLADIWLDKITPYQSALAYVDSLREKGLKPSSVALYRSMLPEFFLSVLGKANFDREVYDRLVPMGDN